MPKLKTALMVVDAQNDFCEGGALPVAGGRDACFAISRYIDTEGDKYDILIVSQDSHLAGYGNGGHIELIGTPDFVNTWPPHCLLGTPGHDLDLYVRDAMQDWEDRTEGRAIRVQKGMGYPAYSVFDKDAKVDGRQQDLMSVLISDQIGGIDIVGLAYDHCVKASAVDAAIRLTTSQPVRILTHLTEAVNWRTAILATREMVKRGVNVEL